MRLDCNTTNIGNRNWSYDLYVSIFNKIEKHSSIHTYIHTHTHTHTHTYTHTSLSTKENGNIGLPWTNIKHFLWLFYQECLLLSTNLFSSNDMFLLIVLIASAKLSRRICYIFWDIILKATQNWTMRRIILMTSLIRTTKLGYKHK